MAALLGIKAHVIWHARSMFWQLRWQLRRETPWGIRRRAETTASFPEYGRDAV